MEYVIRVKIEERAYNTRRAVEQRALNLFEDLSDGDVGAAVTVEEDGQKTVELRSGAGRSIR